MKIEIRTAGIEPTKPLTAHVESRLRLALTRFESRLRRGHGLVEDVTGPRGGKDIRCRVRAELEPRGEIVVRTTGEEPFAAVTHATGRLSHAIARRVRLLNARRRGRVQRPARPLEPATDGR